MEKFFLKVINTKCPKCKLDADGVGKFSEDKMEVISIRCDKCGFKKKIAKCYQN